MKQILFLLIAMSLALTISAQQRDTVKTDDGRTIIININPEKPKLPAPPKKNSPAANQPSTAKEPIVIDLTINHEQQPVYFPEKETNNGLITWLWVISALFFALVCILVTWWILARRRRAEVSLSDALMLHLGNMEHEGFIAHGGNFNLTGKVRHEHFQMPEKKES